MAARLRDEAVDLVLLAQHEPLRLHVPSPRVVTGRCTAGARIAAADDVDLAQCGSGDHRIRIRVRQHVVRRRCMRVRQC